jgi:hypothetical protein
MSNIELSNENLIAASLFSLVHRISETHIRKSPRDEEADNIQPVRNAANIYALLRDDDHIAPCVSTGTATYAVRFIGNLVHLIMSFCVKCP